MQKVQQTPVIQNHLTNSLLASHSSISSDLGIYKLKFSKNENGDTRNKEESRYQKKIQMYTSSVKERMLPKNITQTASFKVAQSKNASMVDSNVSYSQNNNTFNNTNTNVQSNVQNLTFSKHFTQSNLYYPKVGSYATILSASQVKNSQLLVSTQCKQEQAIIEEKQESSTAQNMSSRNYTYRSAQSTNLNSGEQTNKFNLSKQISSQSPNKLLCKSGIQFENSFSQMQNADEKQQNDYFFKKYFTFNQENQERQSQQDKTQSPLFKNQKKEKKFDQRYQSASLDCKVSNNPFLEQSVKSHIKCSPQNFEKYLQTQADIIQNESIQSQSDLSLSKIECENSLIESTQLQQQQQQQNNMKQSQHRDSCSFNFHQPTIIDINSKKNSILSTKNLANFFAMNSSNSNKNMINNQSFSNYQNQQNEQKFIKSLINKLNQINQQNHNLYSLSDLTLEGSAVNGKAVHENSYLKNQNISKVDQSNTLNTLQQNNLTCNIKDQATSSQQNQNNQIADNQDNKQQKDTQNQKKITIIRNASQKQITPIKIMHHKSYSQANLQSQTKLSNSINSQQQTCESTYQSNTNFEKEYNEVVKTEFSSISPIHQNTLSAFANKKRERSYQSVTLPPNSFQFEKNTSIANNNHNNNDYQINTARMQANQGWKCC
ncbi:hypothetical protein ABPG74_002479 [Tetrahymena malaccensis]